MLLIIFDIFPSKSLGTCKDFQGKSIISRSSEVFLDTNNSKTMLDRLSTFRDHRYYPVRISRSTLYLYLFYIPRWRNPLMVSDVVSGWTPLYNAARTHSVRRQWPHRDRPGALRPPRHRGQPAEQTVCFPAGRMVQK